MTFDAILNKEIKSIYYVDEYGTSGEYIAEDQIYHIGLGAIVLEFAGKERFELHTDDDEGGIHLTDSEIEDEYLTENRVNPLDRFWGTISSKLVSSVDVIATEPVNYRSLNGKHLDSKDIISTIRLRFRNGEQLFISNAGYYEKGNLQSGTDDLIVYNKSQIAQFLKNKNGG